MIRTLVAGLCLVSIPLAALRSSAQPPANPPAAERTPAADRTPAPDRPAPKQAEAGPEEAEAGPRNGEGSREERLAEYLDGCKFIGRFTVDGREGGTPKEEEYTISRCEKLALPDLYRLTARIRYGDVNSEVPLDVKILWSGDTPVITLDSFWIPGMGTFSSRVLIHRDRYSGTWQHDDKGGHLFGRIVSTDD